MSVAEAKYLSVQACKYGRAGSYKKLHSYTGRHSSGKAPMRLRAVSESCFNCLFCNPFIPT